MDSVKKVPCGCWDCRRDRGETPPMSQRDQCRRLYPKTVFNHDTPLFKGSKVKMHADTTGRDRTVMPDAPHGMGVLSEHKFADGAIARGYTPASHFGGA